MKVIKKIKCDCGDLQHDYNSLANIPTNLVIKDELNTKQDTLTSGTNIKTINNESILGSGNIEIKQNEGDYIPLGASFYFTSVQSNPKYLKSNGQWNDGNFYTTFYNWLVEEKTTNTSRTDIKNINETYGDFDFVLNQDEKTFRLPLLNGSESLISDRYEDLTFGATETKYIAPANGWASFCKVATAVGQYIQVIAGGISTNSTSATQTQWVRVMHPVTKGMTYTLQYTAGGDVKLSRFCYAKSNGDLYFYVG